MATLSIVEHLDVLEQIGPRLVSGTVANTVSALPLEQAEEAFHQRAVGAGFATWSAVAPENFEVIAGEITIYNSSPGVRRGFCNICGTSLTYAGAGWTDIAALSATLDDPAAAKPTTNVYLDHQQPWVVLDDALRKYQEFPA